MVMFFTLLVLFAVIANGYFRIADYFNIIDKPNERSSHTQITIRGGGILFPIAWFVYIISHEFILPWVSVGLLLISLVSFADDRMALSSRFRFIVHLVAFSCCFYELNLFEILPWWAIFVVYIVGIGCVNAVNFMDGINGMTGLYSLSVLVPVQWFMFGTLWNGSIFNYLMVAILVFGFYNFRKRARCFAGDVGSVSMGYILVFILLGFIFNRFTVDESKLMLVISDNLAFTVTIQYILLLTIYGVDAILTLAQRLYLRENIFEAHRRHLYQLLCNEYKIQHVYISLIYGLMQVAINFYIFQNDLPGIAVLTFLIGMTIIYIAVKYKLINKLQSVKLST